MDKQIKNLKMHYQVESMKSFRLFVIAFTLSLPFLFFNFINLFGGEKILFPLLQLILATLIQFGPGLIFYKLSFDAVKNNRYNFNLLVILSSTAAYFVSLLNYFFNPSYPLFFEIGILILVFALCARWIKFILRERTVGKADKIFSVIPKTVFVEKNGVVEEIFTDQLVVGDVFVVYPGGTIPADGVVLSGQSHVDEAILSSEVMPKKEGSNLFAGTVNQENTLRATAKEVGKKTTLLSIMQIFQKKFLSIEEVPNTLDKFSSYYIPTIILIALAVWLGWLGLELKGWGQNTGLIYALTIITMACSPILALTIYPALIIAVKIGIQNSIFFKDEFVIEKVTKLKRILFDKIGVLTVGCPVVQHIQSSSKYQVSEILNIAASLASQSAHPASRAILKKAFTSNVNFEPAKNYERILGKAVKGVINDKTFYLGSLPYAKEAGVKIESNLNPSFNLEANLFKVEKKAKIVLVVWSDEEIVGYIFIVDSIRDSAAETVLELKDRGILTTMLTEDQRNMAFEVAWQMNFLDFKFDLLPTDKFQEVIMAQKLSGQIGMVGDGIYDAEALAQADISCLIGENRDKEIEYTDINIVCKDLMCLIDAIDLSRATMRKIKQNIFLAVFFNVLAFPLAALGLLNLDLALGAVLMGIVSVTANTLLLFYWKPKRN